EPWLGQRVRREVDDPDQIEHPWALGNRIEPIVGERDDPPFMVDMSRPLDLEPQGAEPAYVRNDEITMIDVGLHLRSHEPAVGTRQDLGRDHQLDEGAQRGSFEHATTLAAATMSAMSRGSADVVVRNEVRVMFIRTSTAADAIRDGWDRMEHLVGTRGRHFYGALDQPTGEYWVCVEMKEGDEPGA